MIVDAHTHIHEKDSDISAYIEGGILPVLTGHSHSANAKTFECAKRFRVPFVLGIAPQTAQTDGLEGMDEWKEFIRQKDPNAIGEIGLDSHWAKGPEQRKMQRSAFEDMLGLAERMKRPIVVHSRETYREIVDILVERKFNGKVMFHFFGDDDPLYALRGLDAHFSMPTIRSKVRKAAIEKIPDDRIMAETDSPYVGKTPFDVIESIDYIAGIKKMGRGEAAKMTSSNAFKFFGWTL